MKSKTKKLFLTLFMFASLSLAACGGSSGSSSTPAGSSDVSESSSSEGSSSSSSSSEVEPAEEVADLYVKVNSQETKIDYLEDFYFYLVEDVQLVTTDVISVYTKDADGEPVAIDIAFVDEDSEDLMNDECNGVKTDGKYSFTFTYHDEDSKYYLRVERIVDPSQEGFAVRFGESGNDYRALVVAAKDPTGEGDVIEKYKIEELDVFKDGAFSFYHDGTVLPTLSDLESTTSKNNINEHPSVATATYTFHNDATNVGIYLKHRVRTTPEPYDNWVFWVEGYEAPVEAPAALHIKRGGVEVAVEDMGVNPGNAGEVCITGVELQENDSVYIVVKGETDSYRKYSDLKDPYLGGLFADDEGDQHNLKVKSGMSGTYNFYVTIEKATESTKTISASRNRTGTETPTNYALSLGAFGTDHDVYYHAWGIFGTETIKLTNQSTVAIKEDVYQFLLVAMEEGKPFAWYDSEHLDNGYVTQSTNQTPQAGKTLTLDVLGNATTPTTFTWVGGTPVTDHYEVTINEAPATGSVVKVHAWKDSTEDVEDVDATVNGTTISFDLTSGVGYTHYILAELLKNETAYGENWINVKRQTEGTLFTTTSASWPTLSGNTVYFTDAYNDWGGTVYLHTWVEGGSDGTSWPGKKMEYLGNNDYGQPVYKLDILGSRDRFIINNGTDAKKTGTLVVGTYFSSTTHKVGFYYDGDGILQPYTSGFIGD